MKYKILLFGTVAAILTGCSTAYRAGQTPDDVYYSPARKMMQDRVRGDRYEDYVGSQEDQYLRMKIRDRQRWGMIEDYNYWNDMRYTPAYSYGFYLNNWYNPYYWNTFSPYYSNFYNPYVGFGYGVGSYYPYSGYYPSYGYRPYTNVFISKYPVQPAQQNVSRPNLNSYNNRYYNNRNSTNNRSSFGNTLRRALEPSENRSYNYSNRNSTTNENTYRAPERTYTPSSGGSSSGGAGSSGGGVSRPPRNR